MLRHPYIAAQFLSDQHLRRIIEQAVAPAFHVVPCELWTETRGSPTTAFARQVAMYLAHVACGLTLTEVGRLFARDRTTVAHACGLVEDRREEPPFDRALELLEGVMRLSIPRAPDRRTIEVLRCLKVQTREQGAGRGEALAVLARLATMARMRPRRACPKTRAIASPFIRRAMDLPSRSRMRRRMAIAHGVRKGWLAPDAAGALFRISAAGLRALRTAKSSAASRDRGPPRNAGLMPSTVRRLKVHWPGSAAARTRTAGR